MCWWTSIPAGHGARPVSWGTSAREDTAPGSRSSFSPAIPIRRPCCGRSSPPPPSSCWTRGSSVPPGRRELKKSPYVPDDIGVHKPYARPENIVPGYRGRRNKKQRGRECPPLRAARRAACDVRQFAASSAFRHIAPPYRRACRALSRTHHSGQPSPLCRIPAHPACAPAGNRLSQGSPIPKESLCPLPAVARNFSASASWAV